MASTTTPAGAKKAAKPAYDTQRQTAPRDEIAHAQVLGVTELHEFLGFQRSTTHMWGLRKALPDPDYVQVNGHKAWRRLTIVKWAAATGRLPQWLYNEGARYIPPEGPTLRRRRGRGLPS